MIRQRREEVYKYEEYEEVFSGTISEIKTIYGGKQLFYEKVMLELELILTIIYLWINN